MRKKGIAGSNNSPKHARMPLEGKKENTPTGTLGGGGWTGMGKKARGGPTNRDIPWRLGRVCEMQIQGK